MEVVPAYGSSVAQYSEAFGDSLAALVVGISPAGDDVPFKYVRFDAFQSESAVRLPPLRNKDLVTLNEFGIYALKSSAAAGTDSSSTQQQPTTIKYVALPYQLGAQLYLRYDENASEVPPAVYKRYVGANQQWNHFN